ncbi:MAG: hypothetical protein ACD_28C00151G0017 [uncultured bacterium]|nr:MAG: hypothetical protein ACD_28C00151G0017 [uncultured bacterium]KKT77073.1 MAG: hypothetical protein UW70_C0004G0012 [Candidatus Peregrinibacteria bacterium GW2011_GWA2_44_7]
MSHKPIPIVPPKLFERREKPKYRPISDDVGENLYQISKIVEGIDTTSPEAAKNIDSFIDMRGRKINLAE